MALYVVLYLIAAAFTFVLVAKFCARTWPGKDHSQLCFAAAIFWPALWMATFAMAMSSGAYKSITKQQEMKKEE